MAGAFIDALRAQALQQAATQQAAAHMAAPPPPAHAADHGAHAHAHRGMQDGALGPEPSPWLQAYAPQAARSAATARSSGQAGPALQAAVADASAAADADAAVQLEHDAGCGTDWPEGLHLPSVRALLLSGCGRYLVLASSKLRYDR